ncbi:3986_t:CDS:2 [Ambispora leptoticha]|uniref:3986_t:CDS:1 n=1 Tax=Ambispora leptoticha TaxID=144679 RepID=A0A9N9A404_9GLOM|nr:3986_t:CDS:2 [Ambispora leptoticha]
MHKTTSKFACLLGFLYHYGIGTEVNLEEMFKWYSISAENNDPIGQTQLGWCYSDAFGTEENNEKAFYWAKKSAENGNYTGAYNLADCYRWGIGTPVSNQDSFYWYKRSAEAGMDCSKFWLARCFRNGWGTNKDIHRALRLYRGIDHSKDDELISWAFEVKDVFNAKSNKKLRDKKAFQGRRLDELREQWRDDLKYAETQTPELQHSERLVSGLCAYYKPFNAMNQSNGIASALDSQ